MAAVLFHRHRQQVLVQDMLTQRHTVMQDDKIVQQEAAVVVVVVVVAVQQQQVVVLARLLLRMVTRMRMQLHSLSVIFVSRLRQVSTDMLGHCRRLTSGPFLLCDAAEPTITQCGHLFWCVPCACLKHCQLSVVYLPVVVVCLFVTAGHAFIE